MEYFVPKRIENSDESLRDFAIRRLGKEAFERLVEPIVGGIFTAKAETLSMQAAMPQFVEMERKHGGLIRGHFAKKDRSRQSSKNASGARYDQFVAPKKGMRWFLDQIAGQLKPSTIYYRHKSMESNVTVSSGKLSLLTPHKKRNPSQMPRIRFSMESSLRLLHT